MKTNLLASLFLISFHLSYCQKKQYLIHTLAFYNLENLFDTINDPNKNDEASPMMEIKEDRTSIYTKKIENLANVLSEIGKDKTKTAPSIIGVAEVENKQVLEDLIESEKLKNHKYEIIHFDSPDLRGIDVGLLYKKEKFIPIDSKRYELKLWATQGYRIYTRDQLLVSGYLENELIHIIVNHWPSRRGGEKKSRILREKAAFLNKKISDSIFSRHPKSKIILMGDLNDNPTNSSLKKILKTQKIGKKKNDTIFYNPYETLYKKGFGTLGYRDNIHLFDQILISGNFISKTRDSLSFYKAKIFNPSFLTLQSGKYKGYPFRSFANGTFTNGFSDHYPVYIYFIKVLE